MKVETTVTYTCEVCGNEHHDANECVECENSHDIENCKHECVEYENRRFMEGYFYIQSCNICKKIKRVGTGAIAEHLAENPEKVFEHFADLTSEWE